MAGRTKDTDRERVHIMLDAGVKAEIQAEAQRERRTFGAHVEHILVEHIGKRAEEAREA